MTWQVSVLVTVATVLIVGLAAFSYLTLGQLRRATREADGLTAELDEVLEKNRLLTAEVASQSAHIDQDHAQIGTLGVAILSLDAEVARLRAAIGRVN